MEQLAVLKELATKYPTGIFETTNPDPIASHIYNLLLKSLTKTQ
jgi:hypothetical protein